MRHAVYPGSFDPLTNGHLDIIERALQFVDRLTIGILINSKKQCLFSLEERMDIARQVTAQFPNVTVDSFSGLMIDYCKNNDIRIVIRGLRAVSDFEYEYAIFLLNRSLLPTLDTVFLMSSHEHSFISSSLVKEVASYGGDISGQVPGYVELKLKHAYAERLGNKK